MNVMFMLCKIMLLTLFVFSVFFQNANAKRLVIAHRGASGYIPEHTFSGAVMAYASGADYLELDVVMTKDGHLIVMHDLTLDETTNVEDVFPDRANNKNKYNVVDFSLNEIKLLKVHERSSRNAKDAAFPSRFPIEYQLFRVPTLDEMILLVKGLSKSFGHNIGLYIELKAPDFHRKYKLDPAKTLLNLLNHHGYQEASDPIFIQSFDSETLKSLRFEHKTKIRLIQLIGENQWKLSDTDFTYLKSKNGMKEVSQYAEGIGPWMNQVVTGIDFSGKVQITELVENARRHDLLIHPYTFRADRLPSYVSSFEELLHIFFNEVQIDGIFTDFPDLVVDYLEKNPIN
jgi:glycerophosphoryl diester phosphodiesterase